MLFVARLLCAIIAEESASRKPRTMASAIYGTGVRLGGALCNSDRGADARLAPAYARSGLDAVIRALKILGMPG